MVVVAVDRLATPRIKVTEAAVLDTVTVTTSPKSLGADLATRAIHIGSAFPSQWAGRVVDVAEQFDLHTSLGHSNDLGEVGIAHFVAVGADEDVTDLGTVDDGGGLLDGGS